MASWTSLAVLSALAVSTLSLPGPGGAYSIPRVGIGRRSPYYVFNSDGRRNYGHNTGEGTFESARLNKAGKLHGEFGYTDIDGNNVNLQYKSGKAGSETRLVIDRNDLLQGQAQSGLTPAATFSSIAKRATLPGQFASGSRRVVTASTASKMTSGSSYSALKTASIGSGGTSEISIYKSNASHSANSDASYSFSYDAGDHSRSESADANLNIEGQFSFVADDGVQRSVSYSAGPNGFQAAGDHLPTPPESHFGDRILSSTGAQTSYGLVAASRLPPNSRLPTPSHIQIVSPVLPMKGSTSSTSLDSYHPSVTASQQTHARPSSTSLSGVPFEEANIQSELRSDGSYDFAYDTLTHSRSESGDSDNNVKGHFDFVADDGQRRGIQYEAGSATGFIVEGAHIPVGPAVPGAPSGQPTGRIVPVQEVPFVDPLADSDADASYGFSFESDQYSRSESADAEGNVQGTYTVVDDDGASRTYRYAAGKGVGFEIEEVSASQGPPPSKPATSTFSGAGSSFSSGAITGAASSSVHGAGSSSSIGVNTAVGLSSVHGAGSSSSIGVNPAVGLSSVHGAGSSSSIGVNPAVGLSSVHGAGSSSSIGVNTAVGLSSVHGAGSSSSKFHGSNSASLSAAAHRGSSSSTSSFHRASSASSLHRESSSTFVGGSVIKTTSLIAPSPGFGRQLASPSFISSSRVPRRNTYKPTSNQGIFPGYKFHQYDTSNNPGKYGYVLILDN